MIDVDLSRALHPLEDLCCRCEGNEVRRSSRAEAEAGSSMEFDIDRCTVRSSEVRCYCALGAVDKLQPAFEVRSVRFAFVEEGGEEAPKLFIEVHLMRVLSQEWAEFLFHDVALSIAVEEWDNDVSTLCPAAFENVVESYGQLRHAEVWAVTVADIQDNISHQSPA